MKSRNFSNQQTLRKETVRFLVNFDIKDRRGFVMLKGFQFGLTKVKDKQACINPLEWRFDVVVGNTARNPFDQILDDGKIIVTLLDCLCVLHRLFPYCRFNVNLQIVQTNGSLLNRYMTGEYLAMAAYALQKDKMIGVRCLPDAGLSELYYAARTMACQEDEHLGIHRYAAAFDSQTDRDASYLAMCKLYDATKEWLRAREINESCELTICDPRKLVREYFQKYFRWRITDCIGWREVWANTYESDFGTETVVPLDHAVMGDDSVFLDDIGVDFEGVIFDDEEYH